MPQKIFFKSRHKPTIARSVSLREFHKNRDKVLIIRAAGGLGDILMHRMIFEDFKLINPSIKIVFATLPCYFDALKDHPFIDELVDCNIVDPQDYNVSYNTTSACNRYEVYMAPFSGLHRSDIWANHCGVELTRHNIHLTVSPEGLKFGQDTVAQYKQKGPVFLLCPISAMIAKNLNETQMKGIVENIRAIGGIVLASHTSPISILMDLHVPIISSNIKNLFGLVQACDYVISADTAQIHIAGGLKKPAIGIFTFADGLVYLKYYSTTFLVQKHRSSHPEWTCGPCYNWPNCPKARGVPKPCLTEITVDMIMDGVKKMMSQFPYSPR